MENKKKYEKYKKENELGFSFFALRDDRKYFLENLAMLINAGVPINKSLVIIGEEVRSFRVKRAIKKMIDNFESGCSFSETIENSGLFSSQVFALIRIGEKSGNLVENLKIIVEQQKKDESFRSKIISACIYPFIIVLVSILIVSGISVFLLPKLADVFSSMHIELPAITKLLMSFTYFIENYGATVVPVLILCIFCFFYFLFIKRETRTIGQYLSFNFFGGKRIIQENELARFGYNMGMLLNSGLSIIECLDALIDVTDFYNYRAFYQKLKNSICEGKSFSQIFRSSDIDDLVPRPIQQMISVAENSGNLPETMISIGKVYEQKVDNTAKNMSVVLEPVLLIIVWIGILFLALAILLPIYSLIGNFNNSI